MCAWVSQTVGKGVYQHIDCLHMPPKKESFQSIIKMQRPVLASQLNSKLGQVGIVSFWEMGLLLIVFVPSWTSECNNFFFFFLNGGSEMYLCI